MTLNEIKNECFSTVVDLYPLEILAVPGRDLFTEIEFEVEKQEDLNTVASREKEISANKALIRAYKEFIKSLRG